MRSKLLFLLAIAVLPFVFACNTAKQNYETVQGDQMGTRIYTLDNGLKVYLSVNSDEPRIQANIAVRVGSKNDPAETTGLSHYLEHLMFKGTPRYGTMNYEAEKPYLDQIEALYEEYRQLTDPAERAAKYHEIDSVSYLASQYSIPNEYDKLMSAIGAQGTNAYTSFDQTVYVENIPSNQVENWAKIQADRFQHMVIRGFHTELEAVYEEKNTTMDRDGDRLLDSLIANLYPEHPYGTQTTIGTQEHLKNPSITNIKKHYDTYYRPNNVAICMAGDFNPDSVMAIIRKYFGEWQPNPSIPRLDVQPLGPLTQVHEANVYGTQAEELYIGWRIPGTADPDNAMLTVVANLLYNGTAGLIDVDVVQKLKALSAFAGNLGMVDYDAFILGGSPLEGQKLEGLRDLLLEEVKKLKAGDFSEELLASIVSNERADLMRNLESNNGRVSTMVSAFLAQLPWADVVNRVDKMKSVTKEQVVAWANKYLVDNGYVVSYKRLGENTSRQEIEKPKITPIQMNRDTVSEFVREVQLSQPAPIEPKFVDFTKDLQVYPLRDSVEVLQTQNTTNGLFSVQYIFPLGTNHSRTIELAAGYMDVLSDEEMSLEAFNAKLYSLAASYSLRVSDREARIYVSGLNENIEETLALVEKHLKTLLPDSALYADYAESTLKERADAKLDMNMMFSGVRSYAYYGPENPFNSVLSNTELKGLDPQKLVDEVKSLFSLPHTVVYYSPDGQEKAMQVLMAAHPAPEQLMPSPKLLHSFEYRKPTTTEVFVASYPSAQVFFSHYTHTGKYYSLDMQPSVNLFNEYFGGSMNAIVFQEIREARALAYSASARFSVPTRLDRPYAMTSFVGTQADKLGDAIAAMNEILANMPLSEKSFKVAQDAIMANLRTDRYSARQIPNYWLSLQKLGLSSDPRIELFAKVPTLTLTDIETFQKENIKPLVYNYAVLGDLKKLNQKPLQQLGPVKVLTQEQIFGY